MESKCALYLLADGGFNRVLTLIYTYDLYICIVVCICVWCIVYYI